MSAIPVTRHPDGSWESLADQAITVAVPGVGLVRVLTAAGFRFDLASIPRLFWRLIPKDGLGLRAPLAHDWLYQHLGACMLAVAGGKAWVPGKVSRAVSDAVLRELVRAEDEQRLAALRAAAHGLHGWPRRKARVRRAGLKRWLWLRRWAAFYAVRVGGWLAWRRSR